MLKVALNLLDKQIKDLLLSNMNEDSKDGLHNLLGDIYDNLKDTGTVIIDIFEGR